MDYLYELQLLKCNNIFSMDRIEFWLLKYSNTYKSIHHSIYSQHLFHLDDGSQIRLPPFGKLTTKEKFLDLYGSLDAVSQFHRNEKYFKKEMLIYYEIKNCRSELKSWTNKNKEFGAEKYGCFLLDYLDYDEEEKVEHLSVFVPSIQELVIYIDRQDFKHTIDFLETFNKLYWKQEI